MRWVANREIYAHFSNDSTSPDACYAQFIGFYVKCQHGDSRGKVRGSLKSLGFILWAPWISVPNFMAIKQVVIGTFHKKTKMLSC